jgi:iron complex transport system ATP-binding protein
MSKKDNMARQLKIENLATGYATGKKGRMVLQSGMRAVLETGQLICILGPNGAGKSTLLSTLAGFQPPLAGTIRFDEKPLQDIDLKSLARLLSVVLTDRFSDLYLTAFDVVRMGRFPYASFFGKMNHRDIALIHETMENLGVAVLQDKLFYNLSDGERQKVLIARALVQDTPFLLLDEPVAFIDSPGRIEIMELLRALAHKQGKAVLMTTHDMETALHYADFLWLMHRDKPLLTGIPEDLVLQGKVGAYFDHPGLRFDLKKGRFVREGEKPQFSETIFVRGGSHEISWLRRALERKGYRVKRGDALTEKDFYVLIEKGQFKLYHLGRQIADAKTVVGVLDILTHLVHQ